MGHRRWSGARSGAVAVLGIIRMALPLRTRLSECPEAFASTRVCGPQRHPRQGAPDVVYRRGQPAANSWARAMVSGGRAGLAQCSWCSCRSPNDSINMLPKVGFPELLLEVPDLTGMTSAFTHISGADPSMEQFALSVCALLLSEACTVGLTPVVKPNVPALTRGGWSRSTRGTCAQRRSSRRRTGRSSTPNAGSTWCGGRVHPHE